ncbi:MAG: hypothetical protein LBJ63_06700, partial [Prevotellaceae bacterium]|nr:hypothetical protein [Prevotellaceae bacterium]
MLNDSGLETFKVTKGAKLYLYSGSIRRNRLEIFTFTDSFGLMHRGWGQFVYNAGEGRSLLPINESLLKLPESENDEVDPRKQVFVPMSLDNKLSPKWTGQQENCYVDSDIISCARLSEQDVILTNPLSRLGSVSGNVNGCLTGSGAFGPVLETKTSGKAVMTGAVGVTYSDSDGETKTTLSFMDMNGDGYPDIVSGNMIQLTNPQGGFGGEKLT